jgi:hypothetical protein
MKKILLSLVFAFVAALSPPAAPALPVLDPELAQADESASERDAAYREGRQALDEERWDAAARHFGDVAARRGKDADAALYWQAYALGKAGDRAGALAAIAELESDYARSRWRDDARALRVEMGEGAGSAGDSDADDDLKLLALNSLMGSSSERALAMLERFLDGEGSEKLRSRALFVLSQNPSERALEILAATARGGRGPELRKSAIRFLGMAQGRASDELAAIYASTSDREVKEEVLKAYMLSQDVDRVLQVYRGEKDPELRAAAVRQLGVMQAGEELMELYRGESSPEVRKQVLKALFVGGQAESLIEIYGAETDPELKALAIRNLGLTHGDAARSFLVDVYRRESGRELKKDVLRSLFLAQASAELIGIARSETDPELRKHAVRQIALIGSDDAVEFMMEILEEE